MACPGFDRGWHHRVLRKYFLAIIGTSLFGTLSEWSGLRRFRNRSKSCDEKSGAVADRMAYARLDQVTLETALDFCAELPAVYPCLTNRGPLTSLRSARFWFEQLLSAPKSLVLMICSVPHQDMRQPSMRHIITVILINIAQGHPKSS